VSLDAAAILLALLLCLGKVVVTASEGRAVEVVRQRALHARQQQLVMFAVKDSSEGIVVTDSVGRIELFNDRAAALFAVKDPARVIGSNISEIVPDFPICPMGEASSGGGRLVPVDCFPVSRPFKLADLDLEISADRTLCKGSHVRKFQAEHIFVYTIRDISARVRIESAEREVKESLAIASAAKTHFIHNMGHELRTPLNAIIGFSDLICAGFDETSGNPRHLEYVGYIREGGMRLLEVINDVLEVTRLESGNVELQLEYIDLGALFRLAFEQEANAESGQRNLRLDIAPEVPLVKLDRWMFTRALNHLLDNAIKFTSPNGCIDVVVMSDAKGDVHIEVQDDGIGVRAEQLSRLTEAFYQADPSLARKHEGTGLGLFLTSKYLALHGARLELESEEGRGFTARIVLPHATAIHAGGGGGPLSRVAPGGHLEEATSSRSVLTAEK